MTEPRAALSSTAQKLGLLGALYFSQGLPFGFFTQALPVIWRREGLSLAQLGFTSLLAIPWALKFLWAPWVDRYGHRKSWIVPLQLLSAALLAALALTSAPTPRTWMAVVIALNLAAATQDIATDGLAVTLLAAHERGLANGLQVAGYRVGMIAGGGLLLILYERLGHARTFASMALLTLLATLPIVLFPEAARARALARPALARAHFVRRPGALRILALLMAYKFGDAFATSMLRPLLADAQLTLTEIGWLLGTVGFTAGLLGALAGGVLVNRLGRKPALLLFGLLQALSIGGYAVLAFGEPGQLTLYAACAAEHFTGGMATAALFTSMMDFCSVESGATDYTVQASAVVIATGVASMLSGFSAAALGYVGHFVLAAGLALAGLGLVVRWYPRAEVIAKLRGAEEEGAACPTFK